MFNTWLILIYACLLTGSLAFDPPDTMNPQYIVKGVGITYIQRHFGHDDCRIELLEKPHNSKLYAEGELVKIKTKWYKVENCRLNRAYFAPCASNLFYQIRDLACSMIEQSSSGRKMVQRDVTNILMKLLRNQSSSHSCCESACTISELIQTCPSQ